LVVKNVRVQARPDGGVASMLSVCFRISEKDQDSDGGPRGLALDQLDNGNGDR
jgi:hypothetical protein